MGIQTMGTHVNGQQSHVQPLARQNSWFSLTLDEVENQLGYLGKPLGSMNLDELLKIVWTAEANQYTRMDIDNASPTYSVQRGASLKLAKAFSGKTVDEVWSEIKHGHKLGGVEEMDSQESETTLGETTLEEFLVKAGIFVAEASLGRDMGLDTALTQQIFMPEMGLSMFPSIDALSDTPMPGRKRDALDLEKTLDRRLRRKIKNRESAARSRDRKQAYHNELVSKVSRLEEENMKLKKEKELERMLPRDLSPGAKYHQLRRTSSF